MPPDLEKLIKALARLPGLGPRSARRAALAMLLRPDHVMRPLAQLMQACADATRRCSECGNLDIQNPCSICADPNRDQKSLCIVTGVEDLWAFERAAIFKGHYHVLGGLLSAMDGIGPADLGLERLQKRIERDSVSEVIIALGATVEGQTTAHYIAERLKNYSTRVSRLAQGLPAGGELNYLDDGTLTAALMARQEM